MAKAKLTADQIKSLRRDYWARMPRSQLKAKYGVSDATIHCHAGGGRKQVREGEKPSGR